MKIDNSIKSFTSGPVATDTDRPPKRAESASAAPAENVHISPMSSQLQAIEQGFAATPIVNTARVAEIKQAIANGHFKVDADKVADRLLKTVQELILAHKA